MRILKSLLPAICCLLLAACGDVSFKAITASPPDRTATLDDEEGEITLSQGVALAVECTSTSGGQHGPCPGMTHHVDDPGVAAVLAADVDELRERYANGTVDTQQPAVFVVTARAVGSTTLRITTEHGGATLMVTVRPAGQP